ncbi:MAG: DUF3501 family protein [Betaproteobacteria bacterium]|nr:DUF3501 family protein [Betaproteobacteria bacterium]
MPKITRDSLMTLEAYAKARPEYRARIMAHKKNRIVPLGAHITLYFEDELTMRYQVQEMLRAERIFEEEGIQEELDAYNPLVPDGSNWKATLMIEYPDVEERKVKLTQLKGVENRVWVRVAGFEPVHAIADEDLERETEEKTSSVHFMRFELTPAMAAAAKAGAAIGAGVDHPAYMEALDPLPANVRDALAGDLAA